MGHPGEDRNDMEIESNDLEPFSRMLPLTGKGTDTRRHV